MSGRNSELVNTENMKKESRSDQKTEFSGVKLNPMVLMSKIGPLPEFSHKSTAKASNNEIALGTPAETSKTLQGSLVPSLDAPITPIETYISLPQPSVANTGSVQIFVPVTQIVPSAVPIEPSAAPPEPYKAASATSPVPTAASIAPVQQAAYNYNAQNASYVGLNETSNKTSTKYPEVSHDTEQSQYASDREAEDKCTITLMFPDWLCLFWTGWLELSGKCVIIMMICLAASIPFGVMSLLHEDKQTRLLSTILLVMTMSTAFGALGSELFLKSMPYGTGATLSKLISKAQQEKDTTRSLLAKKFEGVLIADRVSEARNVINLGNTFCWIACIFALPCGYLMSRNHGWGGEGGAMHDQNSNTIKEIQSSSFVLVMWLVASGFLWCFASKMLKQFGW